MPRDWEANVGITGKAANLLWHGLAANTRQVYTAGQTTYARFASSQGFKPFPVQFEALAEFIAASAEETLMKTTKSYISHLRSYHIDKGYSTDVFNDERIKRILRRAARKYGNRPKRGRLEITSEILQAILATLRDTHDDINVYAAFCTAFAGFLRIGEFTWSTWNNQSVLQSLSRKSIQFVQDGVILQLPASKMDPFRKGISIPLSPSGDINCPVSALRTLVEHYPKPTTAPLFSRLIGPFDRKWVLQKLRQSLLFAGINPVEFSGHSFRRGAANSAFKAGISREDIMKMGRWKSDSIDRYFSLTTANKLLFSLSTQLHTKPGPPNLAPDSQHAHSVNTTNSRDRHAHASVRRKV